jgi:hypothetical protein
MFDTLLLRPSLHCNTSLHFITLHPTTLHYTYRHFTSSHLHFTTLSFSFMHLHFLSFYFTSHHITRHSRDLILKIIYKKVNPFAALKNFSPFHFTFLFYFIHLFTYPINPTLHFTLLFLTTTHFPSPHVPSLFTFYRLYFPSLVCTFLTLVLKICILPWEVPIAPSGSLFQSVMVLFTKEYFPISVLCFLALILQ